MSTLATIGWHLSGSISKTLGNGGGQYSVCKFVNQVRLGDRINSLLSLMGVKGPFGQVPGACFVGFTLFNCGRLISSDIEKTVKLLAQPNGKLRAMGAAVLDVDTWHTGFETATAVGYVGLTFFKNCAPLGVAVKCVDFASNATEFVSETKGFWTNRRPAWIRDQEADGVITPQRARELVGLCLRDRILKVAKVALSLISAVAAVAALFVGSGYAAMAVTALGVLGASVSLLSTLHRNYVDHVKENPRLV